MAKLAVLISGLLLAAESQASNVAEADPSRVQGFLSKYMMASMQRAASSNMIIDDKPVLHPVPQTTKEEENAAQKLLANGSNTPITLSAIGVGLLALVTMLGVRMQRGLRPATVLNDNIVEMKSQDSSINSVAFGEDISELKHGRIATLATLGFPLNVHPFRMGASWMFEADRVLGEWDPLNFLPSDPSAECQPMATFFGVGVSPAAPQPAVFFVAASSSECRRVVVYEDFGLLKGTPFDYGKEWSKEGAGPGGAGANIEDCLTEATMETYMNKNGLRYKMNKTAKEGAGPGG